MPPRLTPDAPAHPHVHEETHSEPGSVNPVDPRIPHAFAAHENDKKAQGKLSLGFGASVDS